MELEKYREINKLSYTELSERLLIEKSTIYNICMKRTIKVSLSNAMKIVKGTGSLVGISDLIRGDL